MRVKILYTIILTFCATSVLLSANKITSAVFYYKAVKIINSENGNKHLVAIKLLEKAKTLNSSYKPIQVLLSSCYSDMSIEYLNQKDFNNAFSSIDKAIAICPIFIKNYELKGTLFRNSGDNIKAIVYYRIALEMSKIVNAMDLSEYHEWQNIIKVPTERYTKMIAEFSRDKNGDQCSF